MKGLDLIMYPFAAPVCFPGQWQTRPEKVMQAITEERLIQALEVGNGVKLEKCTDAEALLYLINASLEMPLNYDYAQIHLYLGTKLMNGNVPDAVKVEELTDWQERLLSELKFKIFNRVYNAFKQEMKEFTKETEKDLEAQERESFKGVVTLDFYT